MNDVKADPMPGIAAEFEGICPPYWPELLKWWRIHNKWPMPHSPNPPDPPDPWRQYDQLYLTLAVQQLSSLIRDKSVAAGIQDITGRSLNQQIGQLGG